MGTFGHKIFESLEENQVDKEINKIESKGEPLLFLKTSKAEARGQRTNEGFVIYKGAILSGVPTKSCPDRTHNLRQRYSDRIKSNILQEDTLFTSPSGAASFVLYSSINGMITWSDKEGRTLKEIESNEE